MKTVLTLFVWLLSLNAFSQNAKETEIRKLEDLERVAILKNDTVSLFTKYWSPKMKVNSPANVVGDISFVKKRLKEGKLNYSSFDRTIEDITFDENIAIVMGRENLVPKGNADNAGKRLTRRYTNIWKNSPKDGWKIIARQSTIVKIE